MDPNVKEFTIEEAARAAGLRRGTLHQWLKEGKVQGVKRRVGSRQVWHLDRETVRQLAREKGQ